MKRTTVLALLLVLVLSACGPETLPAGDVPAEHSATASQPDFTPLATMVESAMAPAASTDSVEPTQAITPTLEGVAPGVTPDFLGGAYPLEIPVPRFLDTTTVPELDNIRFVNPRPLPLDKMMHPFVAVHWMPDGQHVIVSKPPSTDVGNEGRFMSLLVWNLETGAVKPWLDNVQNLSWSNDGAMLYFLSARENGQEIAFDLYRLDLATEQRQLLLEDVGRPYLSSTEYGHDGPDSSVLALDNGVPLLLLPEDGIYIHTKPASGATTGRDRRV